MVNDTMNKDTGTNKSTDEGIRLDVHGWGSSAVMPDYFSVHFEVRAEHSDEDICFDTASKEAEKLLKALDGWKNESDSVSTSSFSFSHYMATREYSRWPQGQMITVVSTTVYVESGR
ncbi:MAG TPA: SIMPL domain-containing protein, partial [Methanocorpusculum sp.]|nr:SIMPL domain-containing protein [Methanocorpusculum sp.]